MFAVYENGKPAILEGTKNNQWKNNRFFTHREAEMYAFAWAFPYPFDYVLELATEMELGKEYDYSMTETKVMMKIVEEE